MNTEPVRLTRFARGAGCGCKIAPQVLDEILAGSPQENFAQLLVGNGSRDDAAVYLLDDGNALISTTDFFTPIVDDAFVFGQVAAANAISDVYAMGGTPTLALAILGWPVERLPAAMAAKVLEGARAVCREAGIPLAGGHSIDSTEPFFGLSVNGLVAPGHLKKNNTARAGDHLLLTKPIGSGILTTAAKRDQLQGEHEPLLHSLLTKLNRVGEKLGRLETVTALTDVTGFGLAGHLLEMAEGSGLGAELLYSRIPVLPGLHIYLSQYIVPDATYRNWKAYSGKIKMEEGVNATEAFQVLPDPQTNGGLLIAVSPEGLAEVQQLLRDEGYSDYMEPIGQFTGKQEAGIRVLA